MYYTTTPVLDNFSDAAIIGLLITSGAIVLRLVVLLFFSDESKKEPLNFFVDFAVLAVLFSLFLIVPRIPATNEKVTATRVTTVQKLETRTNGKTTITEYVPYVEYMTPDGVVALRSAEGQAWPQVAILYRQKTQ